MTNVDTNKAKLTEEQMLMLKLSDQDIKQGKLISQNQLDKDDLKWLKKTVVEMITKTVK